MKLPSAILLCGLVAAGCGGCGGSGSAERDAETIPTDTLVMQDGGELPRRPEAPLRIEGACPFECCTYGTWTTTDSTAVYEEPDPAAASWTVPSGTVLEADAGFVLIRRIGVAVARDSLRIYAEDGDSRRVAAGDTLFILDEVGEGYRRVWHAGAIYQTDLASGLNVAPGAPVAELLVEPERQWWARVRTAAGRAGWLWMDRTPQMEGADACA